MCLVEMEDRLVQELMQHKTMREGPIVLDEAPNYKPMRNGRATDAADNFSPQFLWMSAKSRRGLSINLME